MELNLILMNPFYQKQRSQSITLLVILYHYKILTLLQSIVTQPIHEEVVVISYQGEICGRDTLSWVEYNLNIITYRQA